MVGSYDKVLSASSPDPLFKFFTGDLAATVRESIGDAIEVAYGEMEVGEAEVMMMWEGGGFEDYVKEVSASRAKRGRKESVIGSAIPPKPC